jgi:prepilin signal peptidase PulO-like enzyme (type II secretory pathway)
MKMWGKRGVIQICGYLANVLLAARLTVKLKAHSQSGAAVRKLSLAINSIIIITLCYISVIDYLSYKIPDGFNLVIVVCAFVLSLLDSHETLLRFSLGLGIGLGIAMLAFAIVGQTRRATALGGGDVKLMAALGGWLGPFDVAWAIFFAAALGLGAYGIRHLARAGNASSVVPFGPFLALGAFCAWHLTPASTLAMLISV